MTTQDLGHDRGQGPGQPPALEDSGELGRLFDSSPADIAQTSAAAVTAFVLGLLAALAMPFSLLMALCLGMAVVALVSSIVGMARASRPGIAGGALASVAMVLSLAVLAVIGLRYLGVDTAFGDSLTGTLADWLDALNALLPAP